MKNDDARKFLETGNTFATNRAFTLVELCVVIVTLALLAGLMFPVLARPRESGNRTICTNNLRQMGQAVSMYASDNRDYMAYPNWGNSASGWLYAAGQIPDPTRAPYNTNLVSAYQGGLWFQYLQNPKSYLCPVDLESPFYAQRVNKLSSYTMDASVCGFGKTSASCKITDVWNPACYLLWEPDENALGYGNPGAFDSNDGASYPSSNEGLAGLHTVNGGEILAVGGNVQFVTSQQFRTQSGTLRKSLLWWNPFSSTGQ